MNNNYIKLTFMEYLLFPKNYTKQFIYICIYIYLNTFISQMNFFAKERVTDVENKLMVTEGVCAELLHSCLTLQDPMDCSPPGSSVHVILQGSVLEWTAMPFSRESS